MDSKSTLLVAFGDGTINVYSDFAVVWSAKASIPPALSRQTLPLPPSFGS